MTQAVRDRVIDNAIRDRSGIDVHRLARALDKVIAGKLDIWWWDLERHGRDVARDIARAYARLSEDETHG